MALTSNDSSHSPGALRLFLPLLAAVCLGALASSPVAAENLQARTRIVDLMLCYGKGTDTIAMPGDAQEQLEEGLAIYNSCFTEDARFNLWPPGSDFNVPTALSFPGPELWATAIVAPNVLRGDDGNSIVRDQHVLTNFMVEVKGKTGTLTAYLNNTRTIYDTDPNSGGQVVDVLVSNGTYTLSVERLRGKWMVTELDLKLNSQVSYFSAE